MVLLATVHDAERPFEPVAGKVSEFDNMPGSAGGVVEQKQPGSARRADRARKNPELAMIKFEEFGARQAHGMTQRGDDLARQSGMDHVRKIQLKDVGDVGGREVVVTQHLRFTDGPTAAVSAAINRTMNLESWRESQSTLAVPDFALRVAAPGAKSEADSVGASVAREHLATLAELRM